MRQSDVELLRTVPPAHLKMLILTRARSDPAPPQLQTLAGQEATTPDPAALEQLAAYLFKEGTLTGLLEGLNELERLILEELAASGGQANSRDLALYLTISGHLKRQPSREALLPAPGRPALRSASDYETWFPFECPWHYPAAHPHGLFEQALQHLLELGLLFWKKPPAPTTRDYSAGIYDGLLVLPSAVKELLSSSPAGAAVGVTGEPGAPAEEPGEEIRAFQRLLYRYWSLVASVREGLPLVSNGLLARAALRQLLEQFETQLAASDQARSEGEIPRLLFIRLLLQELGLLRVRAGGLQAAPGEAFFTLPLLERARRCYQAWLERPFWNELGWLPDVIVRPGPAPLEPAHEEVLKARRIVVEQLINRAAAPQEITALIARLKLRAPYLLFPREYGAREERYSIGANPYGWDFRLRRGWLTHREGWYLVEGAFIRAVITGPLQWLGLVRLTTEEGRRETVQLTAGALAVIDATKVAPEEVEPAWGRLIVQPNFEMIALAPVSEGLLVRLDRFAERTGLEHIAQYRLTRASVTRAVQCGMSAAQIQAVLEEAGSGPLPQNVQYSLSEWERQARRVEIWHHTALLEVGREALLDRLFEDEVIRPLLGQRLTARIVMVPRQHLAALAERLWERGYLPALSSPSQEGGRGYGTGLAVEPQWRLHLDGRLEPLCPVTDLYLRARLEQMSEEDEGDEGSGWRRLTRASIERALAAGLSLESILNFLQQYCRGGIPVPLLIRLKLWGNGYGLQRAVRVEAAPLLNLPAGALPDLQLDPEVAPLLGPVVPAERRLVQVEGQQLRRLLQLLRERGFELEEGTDNEFLEKEG
jgi:hypothetical protein